MYYSLYMTAAHAGYMFIGLDSYKDIDCIQLPCVVDSVPKDVTSNSFIAVIGTGFHKGNPRYSESANPG
jgi:hypothetical protein